MKHMTIYLEEILEEFLKKLSVEFPKGIFVDLKIDFLEPFLKETMEHF